MKTVGNSGAQGKLYSASSLFLEVFTLKQNTLGKQQLKQSFDPTNKLISWIWTVFWLLLWNKLEKVGTHGRLFFLWMEMRADLQKRWRRWMSLLHNCIKMVSVVKIILVWEPGALVLAFSTYKLVTNYLTKAYLMKIK